MRWLSTMRKRSRGRSVEPGTRPLTGTCTNVERTVRTVWPVSLCCARTPTAARQSRTEKIQADLIQDSLFRSQLSEFYHALAQHHAKAIPGSVRGTGHQAAAVRGCSLCRILQGRSNVYNGGEWST